MEASPNQNLEPMNPKDAEVLGHIDGVLREYDHQRAQESANWDDLQIMVKGGLLTPQAAEERHIDWLIARGQSLL